MSAAPLITINGLYKEFPIHKGILDQLTIAGGRVVKKHESVKALSGVELIVWKGESLCVVGESGCGKSTLARVIMSLIKPTRGEIRYEQERIDTKGVGELLPYRKKMQMIFQNPYASLNPRMTVRQTLREPMTLHNPELNVAEVNERVVEVTRSVGIDPSWSDRYPHEFSGGQRQRISIARALAVDPEFIVADEPISALDVSIQAQVLNLLMDAREQRALTYLFITHDLAVVEHFGSRVAVMYLGTLCELAPTKKLFSSPQHPYTQALLSAIPRLNQSSSDYIRLRGEVPTPVNLPDGCVFHGRCIHANDRCRRENPALKTYADTAVACHAIEEGRI